MLKTASKTARCLSSSVSRLSSLHDSPRLLHSDSLKDTRRNSKVEEFLNSIKVTHKKPRTAHRRTEAEPSGSNLKALVKTQPKHKFTNPLSKQANLRPAVLSMHVKELAAQGKLEDAVQMVVDAPERMNHVIVWNTLLSVMMKAGKRKRAYALYIDMKRRGHEPTMATYTTMLHGMSMIKNWAAHSVQLEQCHSLYESFQNQVKKSKEHKLDAKYYQGQTACYFRILGNAGLYQKMFDVLYAMDETGPLAPDSYVYTSLLQALLSRRTTEKLGNLSVNEQNASDAKLIWRKMEKDMQRNNTKVDSYVILQALRLLMNGRPTDQQFGLDIVRDYLGLAPPGEDPPPPRVKLESHTFQATLELCMKAKKHRLCTYYVKQVMDQQRANAPSVSELILDHFHIEQVLLALNNLAAVGSLDESARAVEMLHGMQREAALRRLDDGKRNADAIFPRSNTYALALAVCWRCADWARACKVFTLATQFPVEDFQDDGPVAAGETLRPTGRGLNTQALAHMARTALATEDKAAARQCLRMVTLEGVRNDFSEPHLSFYKMKLASAVIKMVSMVIEDASVDERAKWRELKKRSRETLASHVLGEIPPQEEGALGTQSYMDKMQQAIDFEMATRSR